MNIVWMSWKDRKHPAAGGAETVSAELAKRLARDGHRVVFLTAGFPGVAERETVEGFEIVRLGRKLSVYWQAWRYYRKNLKDWADLVIDEVNTMPFFAKFYAKKKNIILSYQLCKEIWFYQMPFPLNAIGYFLEILYIWILRKNFVLTESESTKKDFQKHGFKKDRVLVFPVGLELNPISEKEFTDQKKEEKPTISYLGSIRDMKRPDHILKSFEALKREISDAKLFIIGSGNSKYAKNFFKDIEKSEYKNDITCFGRVDNHKKLEIIKKSHLVCATSVKEGWGLVVTEANSQGTPTVVYNVDGLRDSCKHNHTGLVTGKNDPQELSRKIIQLLKDRSLYEKFRLNAWTDSFNYNYDNSYKIFMNHIESVYENL